MIKMEQEKVHEGGQPGGGEGSSSRGCETQNGYFMGEGIKGGGHEKFAASCKLWAWLGRTQIIGRGKEEGRRAGQSKVRLTALWGFPTTEGGLKRRKGVWLHGRHHVCCVPGGHCWEPMIAEPVNSAIICTSGCSTTQTSLALGSKVLVSQLVNSPNHAPLSTLCPAFHASQSFAYLALVIDLLSLRPTLRFLPPPGFGPLSPLDHEVDPWENDFSQSCPSFKSPNHEKS